MHRTEPLLWRRQRWPQLQTPLYHGLMAKQAKAAAAAKKQVAAPRADQHKATRLQAMPVLAVPTATLKPWGDKWTVKSTFSKKEGMDFGKVFDDVVSKALAEMLGDIPICVPHQKRLIPADANAVEIGPVRMVGGVRAQNFDVGYRPDGVRFAFDSKTLNNSKSMGKNYQNMVNDLATEATTVHSRFPYAVAAFMVVIPSCCVNDRNREAIINTLERLSGRASPIDLAHLAEVMTLVFWDPATGEIDPNWPAKTSPLRIEKFSAAVEEVYVKRYKGLPPHDAGAEVEEEEENDDDDAV